ncbi:hypothetical protein ACAW74_05825 [Fibrella sp. WM1]|uniref:hypothetical protein n=1 Tax=Fibrella musci TaxID=3242485 RepID=UPI003522386B
MNTKLLGGFALLGAPCLAIGLSLESIFGNASRSPWMGLWGILYISGWMASLIALRDLGVFDARSLQARRVGHTLARLILVTLTLANILNVWEMVAPTYKPTLFYIVDLGWPVSNLLMLPIGVAILMARQLYGWQRWAPLAVGCWLPIALLTKNIPDLRYLPLVYSAVAWVLLAVVVLLESARQQRTHTISGIALRDDIPRPLIQE